MAQEAYTVSRGAAPQIDFTALAALSGGYVLQLPDGSAGIVPSDVAAGDVASAETAGLFRLPKAADIALLDGGRAFWDRSARAVTFRKVNDRDFYLGHIVGDQAATATQVVVNLNVPPPTTSTSCGTVPSRSRPGRRLPGGSGCRASMGIRGDGC
ncbi:MAG: DUF2190 family protein [Planctomycetaceae bacterium]|nr:DUF2190 family protein [Planctomycetaceae bacterium]